MATDQNVETFAVCQNCGTLSFDLSKCDSCSVPLAEDAVICYSSEPPPKRLRMQETTEKSITPSNGHSTPTTTAPVPQKLFQTLDNGSSMSSAGPVPQTLFINNMNNRGGIVNNPSPAFSAPAPVPTVNTASTSLSAPQIYMNVQNVLQPATGPPGLQQLSQVANPRQQILTTTPNLQTTLPLLVNQPPPLAPLSSQSFQNNAINRNGSIPVASNSIPPISTVGLPTAVEPAKEQVIHFNAYQVRMGSKKFIPSVPIEVKPTGILMTLQGTVKAPVLINARAITMCKTNWGIYPIILVYLEGSCIRQLRNIFGLSNDVFNAQGTKDIQRRITIFPNLKDSNVSVTEIRDMFHSMQKSDPLRNSARIFVTEITEDETIDVMISSDGPPLTVKEPGEIQKQTNTATIDNRSQIGIATTSAPPAMAIAPPPLTAPAQQTMVPQVGTMLHRLNRPPNPIQQASVSINQVVQQPLSQLTRFTSQAQSRMMTAAPQTLRTMQQAIPQQIHRAPTTVQQHNTPRLQQHSMYHNGVRQQTDMRSQVVARNSPQMPSQGAIAGSDGAHQIVQMPTNNTGWQHLKKTLKKGSIYQVVTQDKQTKFAVWNGDNFLFCQVKETKVELESVRIRLGTMNASLLRPISIEHTGINITMKADRVYNVTIPTDDLAPSFFCIHKKCSCLFIYTTSSGSENMRKTLNMPSMPDGKSNSYYNSKSSVERYKHIVVYLNNVSQEQKNALVAMKDPSTNQTMFKEIHFLAALKTIEEIDKKTDERIVENVGGQESDDDDCIMLAEEVGIKCPYTQKVMIYPIRNKQCGHNYEKEAIIEFIKNKKANARCPYAGCGNRLPLRLEDLEENVELKKLIEKEEKST